MEFKNMIKTLRRQRNMTQEELAEALLISPQAVSRWETGNAMPDISLFPTLCNLFDVSADYLLGIDISKKEAKIRDISAQADKYSSRAYYQEARAILENGLREYPNSYLLMSDLMYVASFQEDDAETEEEQEAYQQESMGLAERILAGCTEDRYRHRAIQILCMAYGARKEYDKARRMAECMPEMCLSKNFLMEYASVGDALFKLKQRRCSALLDQLIVDISNLNTRLDCGKRAFTEEEKAVLRDKTVALIELMFEDGNYGFFCEQLALNHMAQARYYVKKGDAERTLHHLGAAAENAIGFVEWVGQGQSYTCLMFRGMEKDWIGTNDCDNSAKWMMEGMQEKAFDPLRGDPRFGEVEQKLRSYAKAWQVE